MITELAFVVLAFVSSLAFLFVYGGGKSKWYRNRVGWAMMGRAFGYMAIIGYVILVAAGIIPPKAWEGDIAWGLVAFIETAILIIFIQERLVYNRLRKANRIKDGELV